MKKNKIKFDDDDLEGYSSSQLMRIADYRFRKHLLSKWDGRCFISRKKISQDNAEVAHFIPRANKNLRYSKINCHLVSKYSNSYENTLFNKEIYGKLSKHEWEYRKRLVSVYGEKVVEMLENTSNSGIFGKSFYKEVIYNLENND